MCGPAGQRIGPGGHALWATSVAAFLLAGAMAGESKVTGSENRAQWMAEGSYGIMAHYLVTPRGDSPEEKTADLNRIINGFDLDGFMAQFLATGADWFIFTIGQNTGYYNSPNEVLDARLPGHTPRRDLVLEMGRRLHEAGKRFILYLPVETTTPPAEVREAFAWNPADQTEFFRRYLAFIRVYSLRMGALCDGWWFDGWYPSVTRGKWDPAPWCEAARAGNPHSAVAISNAAFCIGTLPPVTPLQDYHGGEVHLLEDGRIRLDFLSGDVYTTPDGKLRKRGQEPRFYMPDSQFIDGVQWHALVPVDSTFNPAVPTMHYSDGMLFKFVKDCKAVRGGVTLNLPIDQRGHFPGESIAQMRRLHEAL